MLTAFVLCALSSSPVLAPAPGDPFSELGLEAAVEQAKKEQKLVLVDFTASWCGPCKKMEKDTWAAAEVKTWLGANALALQVDVDEEKDVARRFRIEAMPTIVALRDGVEFDRIVGYRDASGFLEWARDVRAGKRKSDDHLERSKVLRDDTDIEARYDLAQELFRAKQYDEALAHYLWLWPATRDVPSYGGVRTSFMLLDMAGLARKHEPAAKAFAAILEELQGKIDAADAPAFQDWQEWTSFCRYFGGRARILAWYEKHRDPQGLLFPERDDPLAGIIVSDVYENLIAAERCKEAVGLYPDAGVEARRMVEHYRQMMSSLPDDAEQRASLEDHSRRKLAQDIGRLYGALRVAEREEEAAAAATLLLETLDRPETRVALARAGMDALQKPDPAITRWIDEAEAAGVDVGILRRKLAKLERAADEAGAEKKPR